MEHFWVPYQALSSLPGHAVAVLAPHADDEVLGCGGALASFVAQGRPIHVVVVCAQSDEATTLTRQAESRAAARVIGYSAPVFWEFSDGQLPHAPQLSDKIRDWLVETHADLVLVTSCWEMHRDHRALAEATIAAVVALNGRVQIAFYEVGLPLPPNTLLDITPWKEIKDRAMSCFQSQLARQPYDRHIRALNCYRTYSLPPAVQAAEAYLVLTAQELLERGLNRDPQILSQALHQAAQEQARQPQALVDCQDCLAAMLNSTSWRLTAPLRWVGHLLKDDWRRVRNILKNRLAFQQPLPGPSNSQRIEQRQTVGNNDVRSVVRAPAEGEERWRVEILPESRSAEMAPLYQRVFGKPLSPDFRAWKYGQGRGRVFAAWNWEGKMVAHYGGLVRTVSFFGTPVETCQVGDVMVDPAERGVLTRKGVFSRMTQAFYESQDSQARQAAFGFPNQRAFRVGQRLGFYSSAGKIYLRTWQTTSGAHCSEMRSLWAVSHRDAIAQELWRQMLAHSQHLVLVQRDAEYLDYRYRQRPEGNYGVYLIGPVQLERAQAIVVVKQRESVMDWMDFVGSPDYVGLALAAVKVLATQAGLNQVQAWLTQPMLDAFADETAVTQETDIEVAQWDCDESQGWAEQTRGRWWAMYGDTDFL
ncbi:GNAT family N-acetyltransferase [Ferrovum myxofaciens]|uniref:GNAT family N-acetyltransferase n=1 Tax=Ferrovum myxofaciens TaxID=416213 RepID=UPI002353B11C|nr:GNAT family N-acetyltransferase [Ferrovum myxofaciens]MBU6994210.1 GNAT family N-acetyltransferase [Ferrovum myxofaciens]